MSNPREQVAEQAAEAGWHGDPSGRYAERYWNGAAWTADVKDVEGERMRDETATVDALDVAVRDRVARRGRVESRTSTQAVIVYGKRVNHVLHLILSLVTLGIWVIVWIILAIGSGERRDVLTLQPDGTVTSTRA